MAIIAGGSHRRPKILYILLSCLVVLLVFLYLGSRQFTPAPPERAPLHDQK